MRDLPFLMFQGKCEEALALYTTVIPQSRIIDTSRRDSEAAANSRGSTTAMVFRGS